MIEAAPRDVIVAAQRLAVPDARVQVKHPGGFGGEGGVKHVSNIFSKLGLAPSDADHRWVLAVLRYLDS